LKETFNSWKEYPRKYILASLEYTADMLIFTAIMILVYLPLFFLLFFLQITYFEDAFSAGYIFLRILIQVALYPTAFLGRAILNGGSISTIDSFNKGEEYRFFDVLRRGWKRKWDYIRVEFAVGIFMFLLIFVLISPLVASILLAILVIENIAATLVIILMIMVLVLLLMVLMIPLFIFLYPLIFLSFMHNHRDRIGGIASVRRSLKWMMANRKKTFIFGGLYFIGTILVGYIPFAGILLAGALNLFMFDMTLRMFPKK
jgi:hypothetical protein